MNTSFCFKELKLGVLCVTFLYSLKLIANDKVLGNEEAIDVQFPSTNNSSLYLGGNPARNILGMAATNEKFDGCISDVIVNGNLLSMADATQYKRADVGRCRFTTDTTKPVVVAEENSNEPTTVMTTTTTVAPALLSMADPQSCAKVVKADEEQGAHTVGFSRSFHAEITNVKKREIAKNFIFTFDFRTFYEDGLFGYLTNGDKTFYLGIQLIKGHLEVAYMYEGSHVSLSFDKELNDGKWHLVQLEKASKVLSLTYDGEPKRSNSIANRLEFKPPLNLGGPITADFFKDNGINLVSHSVRGCIRNLKLNQMEISLNDVKVIQDIKTGKCHKDVEPGIYFGGDAWGIYETDFIIEEGINISLEFKTKSTMGILVSVGSDSDSKFGLTLELDKGKVKFGVRNNDGEFRIESDNINKYMFCDNQWHTVQAAIFAGQVSIKVDEGKLLSSSVTGMMEAIETQSPLFIGGYESESGKFKQPASLSQDNFNGCMKKLMINDKFVDWYGLKNDAHLQKDACPTL